MLINKQLTKAEKKAKIKVLRERGDGIAKNLLYRSRNK